MFQQQPPVPATKRDITVKVVDKTTSSAIATVAIVLGDNEYTGETGVQGGKATIENVIEGTYAVTCTKEGYTTLETEITVDSEHDDFEFEMEEVAVEESP